MSKMRFICTIFIFLILIALFTFEIILSNVYSQTTIPPNSKEYLPLLNKVINESWKDLSIKSMTGGQIEQETCMSLKHKKCWNPKAELKTEREYGFGFGQITITDKFNNFEEIKKMDKDLKSWKWEDRYDPYRQLKSLVVYDKFIYNKIFGANSDYDRLCFTLAAYNGGLGGVTQERQLCKLTKNCDSTKWFNNVENTSKKSKKKYKGYGKSFFEINREYVSNILLLRRQKYIPYLEKVEVKEEPIKEESKETIKEKPLVKEDSPKNVTFHEPKIECHWIDRILKKM